MLGQHVAWTGQTLDFVTSMTLYRILMHTSRQTRTTLENQVEAMHKHVILKDHWRKCNVSQDCTYYTEKTKNCGFETIPQNK